MKKAALLILVALVFARCEDQDENTCSTPATVRNLAPNGISIPPGCGWVFELEDGTKLEPHRVFRCGITGSNEDKNFLEIEDPLADFKFIDGKRVLINYETIEGDPSGCLLARSVRIICIQEASQISNE